MVSNHSTGHCHAEPSIKPITLEHTVAGVLDSLPHPAWLIEGSIKDDIWIIETEDPTKRRNTRFKFNFNVPIMPGPVSLTSPSLRHDLTTAKLYVYYSLSPDEGWTTSAQSAHMDFRALLTFLQWKWNRGVQLTSDLTEEWFREYCVSLQRQGLEGLLRSEEKIAMVLDNFRQDPARIPLCKKGSKIYLQNNKVYILAGLTNCRQLSDAAKSLLRAFCNEMEILLLFKHHEPTPGATKNSGRRISEGPHLTPSRIAALLRVWDRLYRLGHRLTFDRLAFNPFADGCGAHQFAESLTAKTRNRTPTIPSEQACYLIDRALRWVLDYSDDVLAVVQRTEELFSTGEYRTQTAALEVALRQVPPTNIGAESPGNPFPISYVSFMRRRSGEDLMSLQRAALLLLPAACAIVIGAFSARRREEVESLRASCLIEKDGEFFLEVWIEKSSRTLEKIPVPNAVAKAIEVLQKLSETRRDRLDGKWLFEFDSLAPYRGSRRGVSFNMSSAMQAFARQVDVPPLPSGEKWHFTAHQFRRFFAIVYFYRFKHPSLAALSQFLRHYNPDVTRQYITEAASGGFQRMAEESRVFSTVQERRLSQWPHATFEEFEETGLQFRTERFRAVFAGEEVMGGFGGQSLTSELKAWITDAERTIQLAGEKRTEAPTLDELIEAFARSKHLVPNAAGHSYCKCGSTKQDLSAANCIKIGTEKRGPNPLPPLAPDHAYAADHICSACPHNVQFAENEPYWRGVLVDSNCLLNQALSEPMQEFARQRRDMAEQHCNRWFNPVSERS